MFRYESVPDTGGERDGQKAMREIAKKAEEVMGDDEYRRLLSKMTTGEELNAEDKELLAQVKDSLDKNE